MHEGFQRAAVKRCGRAAESGLNVADGWLLPSRLPHNTRFLPKPPISIRPLRWLRRRVMAPFGPDRTVLCGKRDIQTTRREPPMARTRSIIIAMLAVSVLAASCGGDEDSAEEPADASSGTSEVGVGEAEQPDSATPDSATEPAEQADAAPKLGLASVRLGERFPWCAPVQAAWDIHTEARTQLDAAEVALQEAQIAVDSATDELDLAEAEQALEAASAAHTDAAATLTGAAREVASLLNLDRVPDDDTEAVAVQRAAEAWRASADPAVVKLSELAVPEIVLTGNRPDPPEADPIVTVEGALAAVAGVKQEIDDVIFGVRDLLLEVDNSITAIRDAESPQAAEAALQRFVDAAHALAEIRLRFRPAVWGWTLPIQPEAHTAEVAEAIQSAKDYVWHRPNIRDDVPEWATKHESAVTAEHYAYYGVKVGLIRAEDALKDAAAVFIVGDTAGMAAFQGSLAESCQP